MITANLKRSKHRHRKSLPSSNNVPTSSDESVTPSKKEWERHPLRHSALWFATMEASSLRRTLPWMFLPADRTIIQAINANGKSETIPKCGVDCMSLTSLALSLRIYVIARSLGGQSERIQSNPVNIDWASMI